MPKDIKVQLRLVDKLTKQVDVAKNKIRQFGMRVKETITRLASLRNAIIAVVAVRLAKYFVDAASSIEMYRKQLEVVTGSAKRADNALMAIREFARTSPLETQDVVQAYVRLRAVGIDPTMKQMKTMGGVAVLMGKQMTDVVGALISRHARTLREYGIQLNAQSKNVVIQSGNIRKVVDRDNASIREAILETWEERFPNAIEVAADTFTAKWLILKSQVLELDKASKKPLNNKAKL